MTSTDLFTVSAGDDTHDVAYADDEFACRTCGATGLADGHLADQTGAQAWHDDTTNQPQTGDDPCEK